MLSGQNGVLKRASEASEAQKDAAEKEQVQLAVIAAMTNNDLGQLTDENLRKAISDTFGSDNGLDGFDPGPWTYTGERNVYDIDENGEIIQSAKLTQEEKDQIVDIVGMPGEVLYVLTRGGEVRATTSKTGNIFNKYELTGDPITTKGIRKKIMDNYFMLFIDNAGKVYTCGYNVYGQLGDGTDDSRKEYTPMCISDIDGSVLNDRKIVDVYTYGVSVIVKDNNGKLYTWGNNYYSYGNLGDGTTEDRSTPICISDISESALNGKKIVDVYFDNDSVIAKDDNGKIYSWGKNYNGQLGDGTKENRSMPICISDISESALNGKKIVDVYFGDGNSVITKDDNGKIYSWGNNEHGQLGDGTTENRSTPMCISDIEESELSDKKIIKCANMSYEFNGNGYLYSGCITEEGECYLIYYSYVIGPS